MDKELLFKSRLNEADVEVPGVGTVRVRGLSRGEVIVMRKATDSAETLDGPRQLVIERKMIASAIVDPVLTEAEVKRWQDASPAGELDPVTNKISELSGLDDDAAKKAVVEFEADPDAEFPDVPGAEAGDDGLRSGPDATG